MDNKGDIFDDDYTEGNTKDAELVADSPAAAEAMATGGKKEAFEVSSTGSSNVKVSVGNVLT